MRHKITCEMTENSPFMTIEEAKSIARTGLNRTRAEAVKAGALVRVCGLVRIDRAKFTEYLKDTAESIS